MAKSSRFWRRCSSASRASSSRSADVRSAVRRSCSRRGNAWQQCRPARGFVAHAAHDRAPAGLLAHPALEKGQRGLPQIEVGVELASEALDVEQRLLQQHELRLDLDVEALRGLKEPQQHLAERDLLQRLVEDRFAHRADRRFELIDGGVLGRPAGFDVGLGDAAIVAAEEREEVLREVVLVEIAQRADDAEVERDVAAVRTDQDVARVHVGVEEAVAEHLREEDLDAGARDVLDARALGADRVDLADGNAVHALHHHHLGGAPVPVHLRHREQRRVEEVAPQLARIRRLAHEVELVVRGCGRTGRRSRAASAACPPPRDSPSGPRQRRAAPGPSR